MPIYTADSSGIMTRHRPIYRADESGKITRIYKIYEFNQDGNPRLVYANAPDWLFQAGSSTTASDDQFNTDVLSGFTNVASGNHIAIGTYSPDGGNSWMKEKHIYGKMLWTCGSGGDVTPGPGGEGQGKDYKIIGNANPQYIDLDGCESMTIEGYLYIGGSSFGGVSVSGWAKAYVNDAEYELATSQFVFGTEAGQGSALETHFKKTITPKMTQSTKFSIGVGGGLWVSVGAANSHADLYITSITMK